jgi:hypothetical protein
MRADGTVKPREFLPCENDGILELSVYAIQGLPEDEIWRLAKREIPKSVLGRGDLAPQEVIPHGLRVNRDDVPPRHANILGWPVLKDEQNAIAVELSGIARPTHRPVEGGTPGS